MDQMALSQPFLTCEEEKCLERVQSQERKPSSNHLSEEEEDFLTHEENCSEKLASGDSKPGSVKSDRSIWGKMIERLWGVFQRSESKRMVESKMEELRPSQRMPHKMKELLRSLSSTNARVAKRNSFRVRGRWQEIQGCDSWADLLHDPNGMHAALRTEVFRYGEFAQAAYSGFERSNVQSRNRGCKYTEASLLEEVNLGSRGYEVTQFLYTTTRLHLPSMFPGVLAKRSWKESNWMGFVAVCTSPQEIARLGRRDILVAWRGTITPLEWVKDLQFWSKLVDFSPQNASNGAKVESGFLSVYNCSNEESPFHKESAQEQVLRAVEKLVKKYKNEELSITITGHSLGSALAILCAHDIAESSWVNLPETSCSSCSRMDDGLEKFFPRTRVPVTVFSFAGPRVGNAAFKSRIEELGVPVLRLVNRNDMVPKFPGLIFRSYEHVGVSFEVNNLKCECEDPTHVHESKEDPQKHDNIVQYLREKHSLRGMLQALSPGCLKGYVNIWEGIQRKRLQFRDRIRRSYLATTFSTLLQNLTTTGNYHPVSAVSGRKDAEFTL